MQALPHHACPLCGGPNQCAPARTGELSTPCWCTHIQVSESALQRVPANSLRKACLCQACASGPPA
ncbi:MAG TPA: cysteine-rich CWC family protein, partial [Aquabacterium sp.]|uniref:cysteine-rich CWC family protein n=1 Tax=Aquabacterium sp. TaxID=1872578 RepID=UPI002E323562